MSVSAGKGALSTRGPVSERAFAAFASAGVAPPHLRQRTGIFGRGSARMPSGLCMSDTHLRFVALMVGLAYREDGVLPFVMSVRRPFHAADAIPYSGRRA